MAITSKFRSTWTMMFIAAGSWSFDSPKAWMFHVAMRIVSPRRGGTLPLSVVVPPPRLRPGSDSPLMAPL